MNTVTQQELSVKPQISEPMCGCTPWSQCPNCKDLFDSYCRCSCDYKRSPEIDPADADQAYARGHLAATEGHQRDSSDYVEINNVYLSYHAGYNAGLAMLKTLGEPVSQGKVGEAAWFDEIAGVTNAQAALGRAAAHVGKAGYDEMSRAEQLACDAECDLMREDIHSFEEWIGQEHSTAPYLF